MILIRRGEDLITLVISGVPDGTTAAKSIYGLLDARLPKVHNGFEHDPEEAACVRVRLLRELAETGEMLVATHLPFPSIGHVAVDGDAFRWVPVFWDYGPLIGLNRQPLR